jgi:nicotinate-nucleotide adenylyltransferase
LIKRLGILGGTFDPPHYGHLLLADTARVELSLERVLFAPAGQPPHKPEAKPSSEAHRVALVEAALADAAEPIFELSRVDLDRPGPHYTIHTLIRLREAYPGADFWFLVGGDSLVDLPKWRAPNQIIALARLGVLSRPGYEPDLEAIQEKLSSRGDSDAKINVRDRIDWLQGPPLDISSTALRERKRAGLSLRFLVPPSVEAYVCQHQLYRAGRTGVRGERGKSNTGLDAGG